MDILTEEEYLNKNETRLLRDFERKDKFEIIWTFKEFTEFQYREYINDIAGDLSDLVFHETNPKKLINIQKVLNG